jgi:hypothetical protein
VRSFLLLIWSLLSLSLPLVYFPCMSVEVTLETIW